MGISVCVLMDRCFFGLDLLTVIKFLLQSFRVTCSSVWFAVTEILLFSLYNNNSHIIDFVIFSLIFFVRSILSQFCEKLLKISNSCCTLSAQRILLQ